MQHQPVVAGAVVRLEHIHVGHHVRLIGGIVWVRGGNERSEQVGAAAIGEAAVSVIALLVNVVGAHQPMFVESVLHAAGRMNGVGRLVRRADQITGGSAAASQAARAGERISAWASSKAARSGGEVRVVDALERSRPSVLRQIVVVDAEAGANYGLPAVAGRVSDAKARRDLLAVVAAVRRAQSESAAPAASRTRRYRLRFGPNL